MGGLHLRPWEPEETIGTLWHRLVGRQDEAKADRGSAVTLDEMRGRMGVLLRGLGGSAAMEIRQAGRERTVRRRGFFERLGHAGETETVPIIADDALDAPREIAAFADRRDNEAAYLWLAAWSALGAPSTADDPDPLRADLLRLRAVLRSTRAVLAAAPGLALPHERLAAAVLRSRRNGRLPPEEAAVEELVRHLLGDDAPLCAAARRFHDIILDPGPLPTDLVAPRQHHAFRPVLLWPDRRPSALAAPVERDHASGPAGKASKAGERKKAARKRSSEANRRDSLILHRFETILSWADFLDLNRKVDDEDEAGARKAAEDTHELGLTNVDKTPATRLSFDLDLSPQDIDRERLATGHLLPEWNHRTATLLPDHVRVLASPPASDLPAAPPPGPAQRRRIAAVRRQFETLMPQRTVQSGESEGDDIDTDAAVRFMTDRAAGHTGRARIFRRLVNRKRDLAVATLLDASRSTESVVEERQVIAIARESLTALGHGLQATGDRHAMYSFSSLKRQRVYVSKLKGFDEPMGAAVEARIAAVSPGFYTRLGAAIRHVTGELVRHGATRRLLLVITDGKPNDLDYYEGRYGIEDTRHAVTEARMAGLAVFAIAIDRKAESYIPHIFGRNGYAIVSHPARLIEALPTIYRHLLT